MKKLTNYQRTANYLIKVFKAVNAEFFGNEIETPTITIQSTAGAYGHVTARKIWNNGQDASYELNISADYLTRPIEDIVATIIHESCHLYAMQNGISDTSNRGVYHNKRFKMIAEEKGYLIVERHPRYGWTLTSPSEVTIDFCVRYSFEDILIGREPRVMLIRPSGDKAGNAGGEAPVALKPSSTRKYICPCCRNSFRATKMINVLCIDCNEKFIIAR